MMALSRTPALVAACCAVAAIVAAQEDKWPTILVAVLLRNKAHTLPYFLTLLSNQDYPKDRITLWISSDNNNDNSVEVLNLWLDRVSDQYHYINLTVDYKDELESEKGFGNWPDSRFERVIFLRERALEYAKNIWADYLFMVDADVFLSDTYALKSLINKRLPLVAPMLNSDGLYSNFWGGMSEDYYYLRSDDYYNIVHRHNISCYQVPMIHSAVLIDLKKTSADLLTYNPKKIEGYNGPLDDIIAFAISANKSGIEMHLCNDKKYGYLMIPLEKGYTIGSDYQQIDNLLVESSYDDYPFDADKMFRNYVRRAVPEKLDFSEIFMINLKRRTDRRERMEMCIKRMGLKVTWLNAVDGLDLNEQVLVKLGVKLMPNYLDPYSKRFEQGLTSVTRIPRPMTMGEIGCFLSHYTIWKKIVNENMKQVMILEDDVHFQPYFKQKLRLLMKEIELKKIDWDLIYLGRKRMRDVDEVEVSPSLVVAEYSYWTVGYIINNKGAKKLLDAKPLDKLLPVDEFLPIMYNKQPEETWAEHFPVKNLIGLSVQPLLIYPTFYTGDEGYTSDTEDSTKVTAAIPNIAKGRDDL